MKRVLLLVLLLVLAIVGCGDDRHLAAPDASSVVVVDAFAEAAHTAPPQAVSGGGPIVIAPRIVPVFFAGDAAQPTLEQFFEELQASSYWTIATAEYGVGALNVTPSVVTHDAPPTTDTALQAWIDANVDGQHGWPTPDQNTIYTVFLPPGAALTFGTDKSCITFGGYHSETATNVVYALIPRCASATGSPLDPTTSATSHELVEATTDPHPFTAPAYTKVDADHLVWGRTPGGELGDMCEYVQTAFQPLVGSFVVQRTWSNASIAAGHDPCVPAIGPYYGAAPALTEEITLMSHGSTVMTRGVTVNMGESKQIEVDLFSDLPSADFSVEAVEANALLGAPPAGLSFAWNRTTGHNGDALQLLITRTKAGSGRGTEFVVRAVENNQVVGLWWGLAAGM